MFTDIGNRFSRIGEQQHVSYYFSRGGENTAVDSFSQNGKSLPARSSSAVALGTAASSADCSMLGEAGPFSHLDAA